MALQTIPQSHGVYDGGYSMAGWLCCISLHSLPSHISGDHLPTTEDMSHSHSSIYSLAYFCLISTLAMSDEIAQDEEDAEDYDLESMGPRDRIPDEDDDDAATLVGSRRGGRDVVAEDNVVFEIGDEDGASDDEEEMKKRRRRLSGEQPRTGEEERRGLMNDGDGRDD